MGHAGSDVEIGVPDARRDRAPTERRDPLLGTARLLVDAGHR